MVGIAPPTRTANVSTPGSLPQPFNPHIFRRAHHRQRHHHQIPIHANANCHATRPCPAMQFAPCEHHAHPERPPPPAQAGPSKCDCRPLRESAATLNRAKPIRRGRGHAQARQHLPRHPQGSAVVLKQAHGHHGRRHTLPSPRPPGCPAARPSAPVHAQLPRRPTVEARRKTSRSTHTTATICTPRASAPVGHGSCIHNTIWSVQSATTRPPPKTRLTPPSSTPPTPSQQVAKGQRIGHPFPRVHAAKSNPSTTGLHPPACLRVFPEFILQKVKPSRESTFVSSQAHGVNSLHLEKGPMAEWLGSALQKLLQRFESASDLQPQKTPSLCLGFFCAQKIRPSLLESEGNGYDSSGFGAMPSG